MRAGLLSLRPRRGFLGADSPSFFARLDTFDWLMPMASAISRVVMRP